MEIKQSVYIEMAVYHGGLTSRAGNHNLKTLILRLFHSKRDKSWHSRWIADKIKPITKSPTYNDSYLRNSKANNHTNTWFTKTSAKQ